MQRRSSEPPVISGYQYVRLLGSGGFSDVFLYDQAFPKRRVAVKVLLLDDLTDDSREAFTAEANVMAQLSAHPYIVTIFQAAVADDDRPFLVMEYCSGPSLADQYKRHPLTVSQTLEVGVRLASAIATAHAAGILHRDIKPANVLTNQFGWPALTDFGISSTVDEMAPTMTTTSLAAGNPAATSGGTASVGMSIPWSPPEMFDDEPNPDVRSDVFSLAATLYTVLAGHTPFEMPGRSNGSVDLISRIARGAITPMPRPDVPASLNAVLLKGMASDPRDRFATAVEFGRALQRVEVELAYPQTPLDVPNLVTERPERSDAGEEASADETRARAIPTVRAQAAPVVPPPSARVAPPPAVTPQETVVRSQPAGSRPPGPPTVASVPDSTQLRRPATVGAPIDSAMADSSTVRRTPVADVASSPESATQRPRRRALVLSIIGAVVLVGAVIGVSAFVANGAQHPPAAASQAPGSGATGKPPAGVDSGPSQPGTPIGVLASGGSRVTFTWVDTNAQKGDEFTWAPLSQDTAGATTTVTTPTVTIPYSGKQVCIQVSTVSSDLQQSATSNGCYPK